MEIVKVIKPQENQPISKLDFERNKVEEINFIKQEENKPRNKTLLELEKLVTKNIKNLVSHKYLCEYENTIK